MATTPKRPRSDTRTRILDAAEKLVQTRGFNAFSYADIASELDVSTASLHYHFAGKAVLGRALIARYAERFNDVLAGIDARLVDPRARLEAYASIYTDLLQRGRFCLCGMLAAEYETLPAPMRDAVIDFFDRNEAWLTGVLELGEEQGTLHLTGRPADLARMIISGLEGAMLVTRPYGEVARFETAAVQLLVSLVGVVPAEEQGQRNLEELED
jgi:TetR/AcrR family transcriptional repressor of nem operon